MFSVFRAYSLALFFFSFSVWVLECRVCWASFAKASWGLLGFRGFRVWVYKVLGFRVYRACRVSGFGVRAFQGSG